MLGWCGVGGLWSGILYMEEVDVGESEWIRRGRGNGGVGARYVISYDRALGSITSLAVDDAGARKYQHRIVSYRIVICAVAPDWNGME